MIGAIIKKRMIKYHLQIEFLFKKLDVFFNFIQN